MLIVPPPPQSIISRATGVEVADAFSTDLWTGNGSTRSITNGIDLSTEGGMVWIKRRDGVNNHVLFDTERAATNYLQSDGTGAEGTDANSLTAFNSDGYSLGADATFGYANFSAWTYVGWTFRKASGFFDVVTYTGNGSSRTISHNLGVEPGMIIVKPTSLVGGWVVYHRSNTGSPATQYLQLNGTGATASYSGFWDDTAPTSSVFSLGSDAGVNGNTHSYVAYLFGHGTGASDIIQCGSYTGNGTTSQSISLGWEPQWLMIKRTDGAGSWLVFDNARGMTTGNDPILYANTTAAEFTGAELVQATATGFDLKADNTVNASSETYIYMAIKAE